MEQAAARPASLACRFGNPKGLVAGATSGGHGAVPKGGYHISQLELLLKVCHLLLWPHMQRYGEGGCAGWRPCLIAWAVLGGLAHFLEAADWSKPCTCQCMSAGIYHYLSLFYRVVRCSFPPNTVLLDETHMLRPLQHSKLETSQ